MKLGTTLPIVAALGLTALAYAPLRAELVGPSTRSEVAVINGGRGGLERAFEVFCAPLVNSVVTLYSEPKLGDARRSTAVVVTSDGLLLGKLSELGDQHIHALDSAGVRHEARLLAADLPSDLALLEVDLPGLVPLEFTPDHTFQVGQWIAAAGPAGRCVAVGAISVPPRELPIENHGFLGVQLDPGGEAGVPISEVIQGGAAAAVGLKKDDVIVSIDGRAMGSSASVQRYLGLTLPGQDIAVVLRRGGEEVVESVRVRSRDLGTFGQPAHAADNLEVSVRRDGFELVVQHDAHVLPRECLAPALDVHGEVVGLHIARMDRPGSLLIPARQVLESLNVLLERAGRLPAVSATPYEPATASKDPAREV